MAHYDFWTHGTAVQVEYPDRTTYLRRTATGTVVRQAPGTSNWFHFPIATPTRVAGNSLDTHDVWVKLQLNDNAKMTAVHVHDGDKAIAKRDGLDIRGPVERYDYNIADVRISNGMVVSVVVEFLDGQPDGEAKFLSAGARFDSNAGIF